MYSSNNDSISAKAWFAVFTKPKHEKRVGEHFHVRGIEGFLPLYQTRSKWKNGLKKLVQLPLFAGYIFVRIDAKGYAPVLSVPGVLSIVGGKSERFPISDSYIHLLQNALEAGKIEPHACLTEGTRVYIRSGIMAGTEGILIRQKNNFRVVLTLEKIMKSFTVEVEIDDIEPIGRVSRTYRVPFIA